MGKGSDSLGSQLDGFMGQGTDASIADVHDYRDDTIARADDGWEGGSIEEQNTALTYSNVQYPVIDMPSKDPGKAHMEAHFFQDQDSGGDYMASDRDSENCRDYGDFPESIGAQDQWDTAPHSCAMSNLNWST